MHILLLCDTSPEGPLQNSILPCYKWNILLQYTAPYFIRTHLPNVLQHIKNCSNEVPKGKPGKLLLEFHHQLKWNLGAIFHTLMQIAGSCRMWNHLFQRWIISRALIQLPLKSKYFACWIGPNCIRGQVNIPIASFLRLPSFSWYCSCWMLRIFCDMIEICLIFCQL